MFRLVFQKSDIAPRAISGAVVIGRKAPADIVIADATVSASHAKLSPRDEDTWTIEDLKSTSGTWVNGRRVSQATVKPGDTITIGKQSIVLEMTGGPSGTELMLGVATMYNAPVVTDELQAALVVVEGAYPERVTTLKKDVTTIGRGAGNTINLADDSKASSSHAMISR
jgi:pSer/pThr/pTyr-binding forkhead associated (FHA) protein